MAFEKQKMIIAVSLLTGFLVYSGYLYTHLPVAETPVSRSVARGKLLWQQHNCTACHQLYGLGGYLGPDLTNEYSRRGPAMIRAFLQFGSNVMPNFKLNEADMNALAGYLQQVDSSGKADPKSFIVKRNGTIAQ